MINNIQLYDVEICDELTNVILLNISTNDKWKYRCRCEKYI